MTDEERLSQTISEIQQLYERWRANAEIFARDLEVVVGRLLAEVGRLLAEQARLQQENNNSVKADAAVRAFESMQAQGYYLHGGDGHIASPQEFVTVIANALKSVLAPVRPCAGFKQGTADSQKTLG